MSEPKPCCGPVRPASSDTNGDERNDIGSRGGMLSAQHRMVRLTETRFAMGCDDVISYPSDGEGPVHDVQIGEFEIGACAISNDDFAAFVDHSGFVTDAERFGWSFVFGGLLPDDFEDTAAVAAAPWWRQVFASDWRHPEGPQSDVDGRGDHPVIHVTHADAVAFCTWADVRLPTEAEWEYASRGGLDQKLFPWGDDLVPDDRHRMNVWQGSFPAENTADDGYVGTAAVATFEPNGFGLYNMCGNVWEWCSDWFDPTYYERSELTNPQGPDEGEMVVMRGGSYLCHESYCRRYRVAARSGNTVDSSAGNIGFRVARSI
ncbi:MAG: formylglycine-generating enzyme family protein [Acidobacteria bacterium]|nr:formylglycine-generating enzyme family protein [Acidobacteriota bacterium]